MGVFGTRRIVPMSR